MRAVLAELAFVHDEDGVRALHGGEAVRDDDRGAAGNHAVERGADADLGLGVDGGSGFVEDEDARSMGEGAGEVDELLLAGGEAGAALAQRFVEAVRAGCG